MFESSSRPNILLCKEGGFYTDYMPKSLGLLKVKVKFLACLVGHYTTNTPEGVEE
jgi:hypothetical protein